MDFKDLKYGDNLENPVEIKDPNHKTYQEIYICGYYYCLNNQKEEAGVYEKFGVLYKV